MNSDLTRAKEWLRNQPLEGFGPGLTWGAALSQNNSTLPGLLAAYAESECSRLASILARVHDSPHESDKWELEVANAIGAKVPTTLREEMERRAIKANEASRLASRVAGLEADVTRWQLLAGKLDCKTCTPGLASRVEELEKGLRELADEEECPCFCDDHESDECCIQAGVSCTTCFAEKLLAGAHAEEKE